jgi:hypothetical protein
MDEKNTTIEQDNVVREVPESRLRPFVSTGAGKAPGTADEGRAKLSQAKV